MTTTTPTLIPTGSCYIDFTSFAAKNLYTAFGPGSSGTDSDSWLQLNNAKKVGSNYYYLDRPANSNTWWDKTSRAISYMVTCSNGVLTGLNSDGSGQAVITATPPAAATPPVAPIAAPSPTPVVTSTPPTVTNTIPFGSCYINFPFYAAKNLYTVFGPGAAVADSDSWLQANNARKIGNDYYYMSSPGYKMSWRDKTSSYRCSRSRSWSYSRNNHLIVSS